MELPVKKIINFINKHEWKILWLLIFLFIVMVFSLVVQKYDNYGYNALDLGIFNQVFYNSSQGNLFNMSIHPHSYLGDHLGLFILILLPIYMIWSSPLTLLFLQAFILGLAAWPLFLIAKKYLSSLWPLLIVIIFLFYPIILNISFFEFHLLPLAIFTLLFCFYFYHRDKFWPFIIFCLLSILVREDVSLVILMFGVLALVEKKKIKWILTPLLLGGLWFVIAMQLTGYFNQYGTYKFLSMYGWLGNSVAEILFNFLAKPWQVFTKIFSLNNFLSLFAIFVPLMALPLLKLKYLIPTILVAVELLLLSPSTTVLINTHYTSLLIPFIFIGLIAALSEITKPKPKNAIYSLITRHKQILLILFATTFIYSFLTLSPIWPALTDKKNNAKNELFINEKISQISEDENILSSFKFLPNLSSRPQVYSLHYLFLGKKQHSYSDFKIPVTLDKALINFDDFIIYYVQTKYDGRTAKLYPDGADNVKTKLSQDNLALTDIFDSYAYYEKDAEPKYQLVGFNRNFSGNNTSQKINGQLQLAGVEKNNNQVPGTLGLSFYWQAKSQIDDDYFLLLTAQKDNKKIYQKIYSLGYLLYPTSTWQPDQTVTTNYWFYLPDQIAKKYTNLEFQVIQIIDGHLKLDGQRSAELAISEIKNIGPSFTVDYNTL